LAVILLPAAGLAQVPHRGEDSQAFGLYLTTESKNIPLPLAQTKVSGTVLGFVAHVKVTQVYVNPYDAVIEATYVFPLPEEAAVNSMIMHLSDRDVVAEIQEKEKAQKIYEDAVARGHTAALMTQERPNIFTQKVGNIPAGDKIEVELTYVEALPYEAGVSSFVFPTVVGPRYIPGAPLPRPDQEKNARCPDTDRVPDASKISPPVLAKNETSAHRIDLELTVDPGVPISKLSSPSHQLLVERPSDEKAIVRLAATDRFPNKDFILRVDLRSKRPAVAVLAHRVPGKDGYFTLAVQPPALPKPADIAAKDLFFVVDNSGSMHGRPIEACKDLMRVALKNMNPDDRFTIMRFSTNVSGLSSGPLPNTPENVRAGLDFVDRMSGMGGTNMLAGIRAALNGSVEPGRVRIVFFLTDGYIGNETEILKAIQEENQVEARIFSLGVGSSVNRYLLTGMSRVGRGESQVMRYDEDPKPFVTSFYQRVRNPVLTDVRMDWGGLWIEDQTPAQVPDMFDNRPLLVHGRYREGGQVTVTIKGMLGRREFVHRIPINLPDVQERPSVASLWARARIKELMDQEARWNGNSKQEITRLALEHSLMSKYTAFVAVDRERVSRRTSESLIPVAQRLPLPDGVTRRALGCLSRQFIPPGDPIITVAAPADARRVTAYFPFGLVKDLRFDDNRGVWRGRFLVPAGIADGDYDVRIAVTLNSGRLINHRTSYRLDSQAEEFIVRFSSDQVREKEAFEIHVDAVEPAAEVYVDCPELGWKRLKLSPADGKKQIDWVAWLTIPDGVVAGEYELLVVVRDKAGNRLERKVKITVESAK
jgi:Ca-activated chloride channel family protein